jgi:hypothetical protein
VYDGIFVRVAGLLLGRWREADAFANPAAQNQCYYDCLSIYHCDYTRDDYNIKYIVTLGTFLSEL